MEQNNSNNFPNMIGNGNQNIYDTINLSHQGSTMNYLPRGGPNIHYLVNGGRLFVDLNIEGPSGASNNGPSAVRVHSSEGISRGIDLNEIPTETTEELYYESENPSMQWSGSLSPHVGSGSLGHTNEIIQNNGSNRGSRIQHSIRRGTLHRMETFAPGGSSSGILSDEPYTIAPVRSTTSIIVEAPIIAPGVIEASTSTAMRVVTSFRIRDILARRDNILHESIHYEPFAPVQHNTFGSGTGLQPRSPNLISTSSANAQDTTLGQTLNTQNVSFAQQYVQSSNLQPHTNFQPESSFITNDAQNFLGSPTQMVEPLHHQSTTQIFISDPNEVHYVGPEMQSRFSVNLRDLGLDVQPNENFLPRVNSNPQREITSLQRTTTVIEISDDENDEIDGLDENDDMQLDIEEMSYEELLDLAQRIGAVNTGLTEEVIMERLVRRYYRAAKSVPPEDVDSCCICLVDFKNRDVLGRINCTHNFHFDCIKQWLKEKNFCPICKRTALPPN